MLKNPTADDLWAEILSDAARAARDEPAVAPFIDEIFLSRSDLFDAVCYRISAKLEYRSRRHIGLYDIFREAFASDGNFSSKE